MEQLTVILMATSLVGLLDCLTAIEKVLMSVTSLEKLMGNYWETLMEILKESRLVHSTGEQKVQLTEKSSETSLVCWWDCSMAMQKVQLLATK